MMMSGGKPGASAPANPVAAQTDETTTLDHLATDTAYTVSGTLNSGPTDGVVQLSLSRAGGFIVPIAGGSNNEGHLMRATDGYPQSFSLGFDSPSDVTGFQLRILSATSGWDIDHTVNGPPSSDPPAVDESTPTSQGQVPTTLPEVYEADASTDTPTEDLAAYQTHEPDPAVDVAGAADYEIGWGTLIATALKAHGPNQAALDWVGGEIFYWHKIRDNASEPLKSVAQQNATFWGSMEGRILGGIPVPPWNSFTYLEMAYRWGWYCTSMFHHTAAGNDLVGIQTWNSSKNDYP